MLFSATMPSPVVALARRYMRKPTFLRAEVEEVRIAPETEQYFFSCHRMDKAAVLARILQSPQRGLCVVFNRTKRMADILAEELRERGINASPLHSDLRQDARERAMARFRNGTIDVLVATEVAARGLDITDVTHVVNYDCPDDEKMYLHRIGRTGRAGGSGVAITFALWNELARLEMIKKALGIVTETVEVFSTSPLLDELFDLPPRGRGARRRMAGPVDDEPVAARGVPRRSEPPPGRRPRAASAATARPAPTGPADGGADAVGVVAGALTARRCPPGPRCRAGVRDGARLGGRRRPAAPATATASGRPTPTGAGDEGQRPATRRRVRSRRGTTTAPPDGVPADGAAAGSGASDATAGARAGEAAALGDGGDTAGAAGLGEKPRRSA